MRLILLFIPFFIIPIFSLAQQVTATKDSMVCTSRKQAIEKIEKKIIENVRNFNVSKLTLIDLGKIQDGLNRSLTGAYLDKKLSSVTFLPEECQEVITKINLSNPSNIEVEADDQAKLQNCLNKGLDNINKEIKNLKKEIEIGLQTDKDLRAELFMARDISQQMGCDVPITALPNVSDIDSDLQDTTPSGPPSPDNNIAPFPASDLSPSTNMNMELDSFLGKWGGTVKVIQSNTPGAVGASQPYELEISLGGGKGVILTSFAGVIGNPTAYQVKVEENHLRVEYRGPPTTYTLPTVDSNLHYWIDLILEGDRLKGKSYTHVTSSYQGEHTEIEMMLSVDLQKR